MDWAFVKQELNAGTEPDQETAPVHLDRDAVEKKYPLDGLDPTQRVFATIVLEWIKDTALTYERVRATGKQERIPKLRSWLGGSTGSGKSTTLKACVQHGRLLFQELGIDGTIELTACTGVAAFNIGFGAKTACSSFQIFPNATWKKELAGEAYRKLERQWRKVQLLVVDEVSFIGRAFLARMHFRLQQAKRRQLDEARVDALGCVECISWDWYGHFRTYIFLRSDGHTYVGLGNEPRDATGGHGICCIVAL